MDLAYYKQYEPFFGSWYIDHVIGGGSYGVVFEIVREDYGHIYRSAMKVITIPASPSEYQSNLDSGMDEESITHYYRSVVEELVNEFALMSRMKGHSNIVSYEDHVVAEHKSERRWDIFIRMELLTPLSSFSRGKKFSQENVVQLGIDMCRALELCRKHKIIHRDVKPENILVSADGNYKLGDFGVARTTEKTMSGMSKKGTYTYMAPEVYRAQPYGASVDIYSLGIVLYKLLNNNKPPFISADKTAIMPNEQENALTRRIRGEEIPPPAMADKYLAGIVLKACSFEPEDRYASPTLMRRDLEQYLRDPEKVAVAEKGNGRSTAGTNSTKNPDDPDKTAKINNVTDEAAQKDEGTIPLIPYPQDDSDGTKDGDSSPNSEKQPQNQAPGPGPAVAGGTPPPLDNGKTGNKKITIVLVLAAILIAAAVLVFVLKNNKAMDQYEEKIAAAEAVAVSDPAQALTLLDEAQNIKPGEVEAYRRYAYILYQTKDYQQCVNYAEEKLQKFEEDKALQQILASACFEIGAYDKAAEHYLALSEAGDMDNQSVLNYAVSLARSGNYDAASEAIASKIDQDNKPAAAEYIQGEISYARAEYVAAAEQFKSALETVVDNDELLRRCYISLAETYRDGAQIDASNADYIESGIYREIEILNEALSGSTLKNDTVILEMLGKAYYDRGNDGTDYDDLMAAADAFKRVLELGVVKESLYENIFVIYEKLGEYGLAESVLDDMKNSYPDSYRSHALRSMLYILIENGRDASERNFYAAQEEYQTAQALVKSSDDQSLLQQLNGLFAELQSKGWL